VKNIETDAVIVGAGIIGACIPFEELTVEQVKERLPFIDRRVFGPPRRPEDPGFFDGLSLIQWGWSAAVRRPYRGVI